MQSRNSLVMMGLLSAVIGLSACQKPTESDPAATDAATEEPAVPMSADPAEPHQAIEGEEVVDPSAAEVAEDTVTDVETGAAKKLNYSCTPALKLDVVYHDEAKNVTVNTDKGNLTLEEIGEDAYEVKTALDGSNGLTQWRVSNDHRESGVLRVSMGDDDKVTAYECKAGGK